MLDVQIFKFQSSRPQGHSLNFFSIRRETPFIKCQYPIVFSDDFFFTFGISIQFQCPHQTLAYLKMSGYIFFYSCIDLLKVTEKKKNRSEEIKSQKFIKLTIKFMVLRSIYLFTFSYSHIAVLGIFDKHPRICTSQDTSAWLTLTVKNITILRLATSTLGALLLICEIN